MTEPSGDTGDTGADTDSEVNGVPNADTGVGIGAAGESTTFEPEEDPEPVEEPEQ